MKKKYSVKERHLFSLIFAKGRSAAYGDVIVHCLRDRPPKSRNFKTTPRTRFGFAAPNKLGGAVQRVRAKRLMREAARELLPIIENGWLITITARISILDKTCKTQRVRTSLLRAMGQLNLIKS